MVYLLNMAFFHPFQKFSEGIAEHACMVVENLANDVYWATGSVWIFSMKRSLIGREPLRQYPLVI